MERSITATEANREFSRVFNEVAGGETYVVTARGKPLVRMTPITSGEADKAQRNRKVRALLDRMAEMPLRHAGPITRDDGYE
ncbi:MAG: type II toxin-antitoxin system Phd/YefM family antitoxin [Brevundimonas sp.]